MTVYRLGYKAVSKLAFVREDQVAFPGGTQSLGTFEDLTGDAWVIFHYVRDALYKIGVLDMQSVKILKNTFDPNDLDAVYNPGSPAVASTLVGGSAVVGGALAANFTIKIGTAAAKAVVMAATSGGNTATQNGDALVAAINGTAAIGVVATAAAGTITLTRADGKVITVAGGAEAGFADPAVSTNGVEAVPPFYS